MPETKFGIPMPNLAFWVAQALAAMPFDDADRVFKKLQYGFGLEGANEAGEVEIRFKDGSPFIRMAEADLLKPIPKWSYAK